MPILASNSSERTFLFFSEIKFFKVILFAVLLLFSTIFAYFSNFLRDEKVEEASASYFVAYDLHNNLCVATDFHNACTFV